MLEQINNWKRFASRGNIADIIIGFTGGAAFATLTRSLAENIITPLIAFTTGRINFEDRFFVLRLPLGATLPPNRTLQEAREVGAITLNYGLFFNHLFSFLLVVVAIYLLMRLIQRVDKLLEARYKLTLNDVLPLEKPCPYCYSSIPAKATRCRHCTSHIEG